MPIRLLGSDGWKNSSRYVKVNWQPSNAGMRRTSNSPRTATVLLLAKIERLECYAPNAGPQLRAEFERRVDALLARFADPVRASSGG